MTTLSINVPDEVRAAAEAVVAEGRFATVSEYIATLIRQDRAATATEDPAVEARLVDRVNAGPATEMTDADFDAIRARVAAEARRRRGTGTP